MADNCRPIGWPSASAGVGFAMGDRYVVGCPRPGRPPFVADRRLTGLGTPILDDVEARPPRQDRPQGFIQRFVRGLYHEPVLGHRPYICRRMTSPGPVRVELASRLRGVPMLLF